LHQLQITLVGDLILLTILLLTFTTIIWDGIIGAITTIGLGTIGVGIIGAGIMVGMEIIGDIIITMALVGEWDGIHGTDQAGMATMVADIMEIIGATIMVTQDIFTPILVVEEIQIL
jgi:hypothetical protein